MLIKTIDNSSNNKVAKFASKAITVITEGDSIPGSSRDPNQVTTKGFKGILAILVMLTVLKEQ